MIKIILLILLLTASNYCDEIKSLSERLKSKISNKERVDIYLKLGDISKQHGLLLDALNYYMLALNLSTTKRQRYDSLIKLSDTHHKLGNLSKAIEFINESRKIKPRDIFLMKKLATYYEEAEMPELAINQYKKILTIKKDSEVLEKLGDIYKKRGLYNTAISYYKMNILDTGISERIFQKLSICYENLQEYSLAELMLNKFLSQNPNYDGYILLGKLHYRQRNYAKAAEAFSKGIGLAPQKTEAFIYAGISFYKNAQFKKAEEIFKILLEKNQDSPLVNFFLGLIYKKSGRHLEGRLHLEKARTTTHNDLLRKYIVNLTFN